ncbi:hypothetical protein TWF506_011075 [Arthrobotrys conoides]|uniref:Zn(2)-C6 fungal-type domain-containing protein n=1 Tax=Arthrobotrys conoides TaxID=74498 RepID=A0AAN8N5R7_9PEZI
MGGQNPSRKSHTKSRKGCKTCKRRHIRCDETFPQCRNCTKHNVRCDYMDAPPPSDDSNSLPPSTPVSPEYMAQDLWRRSQVPMLRSTTHLSPYDAPTMRPRSSQDMRLLHDISRIASHMQMADPVLYRVWAREIPLLKFLRLAVRHEFVMEAILSLSAAHLASVSSTTESRQISFQHGGVAMKGLQDELSRFSRSNADACLAASVLLSWQASDWNAWKTLMEGTTIIIQSMQSWKHESEFSEFIASLEDANSGETFSTRPSLTEQRQIVANARASLEFLEIEAVNKPVEQQALSTLFSFLNNLETQLPMSNHDHEYQMIHPLASWLFFLPLSFLRRAKSDPMVMVFLANFYGLLLAIEPLFPAVDSAYFGALCLGPIEQIHRHIRYQRHHAALLHPSMLLSDYNVDYSRQLNCLQFPMDQVLRYRNRHGWMPKHVDEFDPEASRLYDAQIDFEIVMNETAAQWSPYDESRTFDQFKQYPNYNTTPSPAHTPVQAPYQNMQYQYPFATRQGMQPKSHSEMDPSFGEYEFFCSNVQQQHQQPMILNSASSASSPEYMWL